VVDRKRLRDEARRCLGLLEVDLDPDVPVSELSVAQGQLVEIAKALSLDNKILLLDEPTASLTGDEADRLYTVVRRLRDHGHRSAGRAECRRGRAFGWVHHEQSRGFDGRTGVRKSGTRGARGGRPSGPRAAPDRGFDVGRSP
jgi:ABC-type iron transport system FetAB ATPase subunit